MKTLLLTEKDIKKLLTIEEVIQAVESAFKSKGLGKAQMPEKVYLFYTKHKGDLRVMPSYLEAQDVSAVKIVNVHPENPTKHDLRTVMAIIILVDPRTGAPLAITGGSGITDLRTGAAGSIAAKHLARKDAQVVGLVGAGAQARTQLMGLISLYKTLEEVRVWSRTEKTRRAYTSEMKAMFDTIERMVPVTMVSDAVEGADIVVTTTPSRKPIVSNKWVEDGTHFNCIGADAPGKEELDPRILTRAKIVVDDLEQASHSGEINVPLTKGIITKNTIWGDICEIAAGLKQGRTSHDEITVFVSTGLAVQDAATVNLAYEKALADGTGETIGIL